MRNLFVSGLTTLVLISLSLQAQASPEERLEVIYASAEAETMVTVTNPMFRPVGNFMMMNVKAQNVSTVAARFEYKVDWYDQEGFPLKGVSGWQTLILSPNQVEDLRVAGQVKGAYRARVTVR